MPQLPLTPQKTRTTSAWIIVFRILFTAALIATVAFIFLNSSQIGSASGTLSRRATALLNRIFAKRGTFAISEQLVRKLGHLAEFALLGFWFMLTLRVYTRRVLAFIAWPLLSGLLVAVLDEFLQNFVAGRSSQVSDILIDFCGLLVGLSCGLVLLLLLHLIVKRFQRKKQPA